MISPEDTYPGRATPADASYPEGSIKNETIPNSSDDGTPLDELWGNDTEGLKQAIARSCGIVPTAPGNVPDTATNSQVLHGLIEMMQGRATMYNEAGVVNAYVLAAQANQQAPESLFDTQEFEFIVSITNTGASTIDLLGLGGGVKNIVNTAIKGTLLAGNRVTVKYRSGSDDCEIIKGSGLTSSPSGHIHGLTLSNDVDADHDITIAIGNAVDSNNDLSLELTASLTKQIDVAWAAGDNAGGRFPAAAVAIDTWYHVFLIKKDSDGTTEAGFDTSVTAVNIPAGYTAYRRIGSVLTDGSANIIAFKQVGNEFIWELPIRDYTGAPATSRVEHTMSSPLDVNCMVRVDIHGTDTASAGGMLRLYSPYAADAAVTSANASLQLYHFTSNGEGYGIQVEILTNLLSQMSVRSASTVANTNLNTVGYTDFRGQ